jgi:hypothetical protein
MADPYADLDAPAADANGELDRRCPVCGKLEPVSVDVLDAARESGLPDAWVCFACWWEQAERSQQ